MARLLRALTSGHGNQVNNFDLLRNNSGGLILFVCFMSIAIISMLLFGCADGHDREKRTSAARRRASVYSATGGGDVGGCGVYGGHGGGGSHCGGGGCGGGGGGC